MMSSEDGTRAVYFIDDFFNDQNRVKQILQIDGQAYIHWNNCRNMIFAYMRENNIDYTPGIFYKEPFDDFMVEMAIKEVELFKNDLDDKFRSEWTKARNALNKWIRYHRIFFGKS